MNSGATFSQHLAHPRNRQQHPRALQWARRRGGCCG